MVLPHCVRSLRLPLGLFTGLLPGTLSIFLIWTVRSLTLTGRSPMASSTLRSVLCLSGCQFLCPVFVMLRWNHLSTCFSTVLLLRVFGLGCSLWCFVFLLCPVILCQHALFGFSSDELRVTPRIFVYLLKVCKLLIWQSRNDFRFRTSRPGATSIIAQVKARVRLHLPLFFKRFMSWSTRGVVASVAAGQVSLNI